MDKVELAQGAQDSLVLEIRQIDQTLEKPLAVFFRHLRKSKDDRYFHPHPFTDAEARRYAQYSGKDMYYVLVDGCRVLGYGMLRGWDEGYEVPSLGIAIQPSARGQGLGKLLMRFLHAAARHRGAKRIRLKVYSENTVAVKLYQGLGYSFQSRESEQLVGFFEL